MKRQSKNFKKASSLVDKDKTYKIEEAVSILKQTPMLKFDESVDVAIHLSIDTKKSDQSFRGTVMLPNGTGKTKRIAVFCKGEAEKEAREAGADFIGAEDLISKVSGGWLDFDVAVSTPDMMRELSKLGKILGPRGLMPSPKTQTVTNNIRQAVNELKRGKVEFKSDKQAGIHVAVGKKSFEAPQLVENIRTLLSAILASKPASVKGEFIKSISISSTMGPGFRVML